jgi:polyribonucleotide nucleotidyltransferase
MYYRQQPLDEGLPEINSIHRGIVRNIRPFGLFVDLEGFRRNGLVHNSQISEEIAFTREDEDDAKVKAMEYFVPVGSKVIDCHCMYFIQPLWTSWLYQAR